MAANSPGLTIQFDANGTLHTVKFTDFGGESVRGFVDTAPASFSATGSLSQSGQTRATRRTWTVAAHVKEADSYKLEALYEAYDALRATGATAVVAVTDETRRPAGAAPLTASAIFTAAPTFDGGQNGNPNHVISFGLTEV